MRLCSIILETVADQIEKIASRDKVPAAVVPVMAKQVSDKYWKWVVRSWSNNIIRLPDDANKVHNILQQFKTLSYRLSPQQRDINVYRSLDDIKQVVDPIIGVTASKKSHDINLPGVTVVDVKGPYTTISITDPSSLAKLGRGTSWCTREDHPDCSAENYIRRFGKVFMVLQSGRPVLQYDPQYIEIKDIDNMSISSRAVFSAEVEDRPKLLSLVIPPDLERIAAEQDWGKAAQVGFNYAYQVLNSRWPEAESYILKAAQSGQGIQHGESVPIAYAVHLIGGRWKEVERFLMKDPKEAAMYASQILKDIEGINRWPEAEPYIIKHPDAILHYARLVIEGRWPEAEPYLLKYCKDELELNKQMQDEWARSGGRSGSNRFVSKWGQSAIHIAQEYARDFIDEPTELAIHILGDRWPELEPYVTDMSNLFEK